MPPARRTAPADPYADLPVAIRRANLESHRQALLSDRMATELHGQRLEALGDTDGAAKLPDKVAAFDALIADVDAKLEALPAEDADDEESDAG